MPEEVLGEKSWGDRMEEDDKFGLPPPVEIIEGNIKKIIEYRFNEDDKKEKVTRTFDIQTRKVPKIIAIRKSWKKFGQAKRDNPHGPDPSTTFLGEEVSLAFTSNREELEAKSSESEINKLKGLGSSLVKCRYCNGDHWSTMCRYKDTIQSLKDKDDKDILTPPSELAQSAAVAQSVTGTKYIPPSQRAGATGTQRQGESMNSRRNDDQATLRVTNLSEEATEADLQELFRPFGSLQRVFLAKDKITNQSKGFAFVSYVKRDDAARAIKALQGFGYDHLILNVEWSKPSTN